MSYFFSNSSDITICFFCILSWLFQGGGCRQWTSHVVCAFKTLVSEWEGDSYTTSRLKMGDSDTKVNHDSQKWQGRNAKIGRELEEGGNFWGFHREGFIWVEPERVCMFWEFKYFKAYRQEKGVNDGQELARSTTFLQRKQTLASHLWQAATLE